MKIKPLPIGSRTLVNEKSLDPCLIGKNYFYISLVKGKEKAIENYLVVFTKARLSWSLVVPLTWDKIEIIAMFLPLQYDLCALLVLSMQEKQPLFTDNLVWKRSYQQGLAREISPSA